MFTLKFDQPKCAKFVTYKRASAAIKSEPRYDKPILVAAGPDLKKRNSFYRLSVFRFFFFSVRSSFGKSYATSTASTRPDRITENPIYNWNGSTSTIPRRSVTYPRKTGGLSFIIIIIRTIAKRLRSSCILRRRQRGGGHASWDDALWFTTIERIGRDGRAQFRLKNQEVRSGNISKFARLRLPHDGRRYKMGPND